MSTTTTIPTTLPPLAEAMTARDLVANSPFSVED